MNFEGVVNNDSVDEHQITSMGGAITNTSISPESLNLKKIK